MAQGGLPYDARVEYLQSSGTQYINTEIAPNDYTKVECTIYNDATDSWYVFGSRSGSSFHFAQSGTTSNSKITAYVNDVTVDTGWNRSTDGGCVYNIMLETKNGLYDYFIKNVTLNKTYTANNVQYNLLGEEISIKIYILAIRAANILNGTSRLYSFKITKNDSVVLDLIPVRVGQVGYMYDRVSGQLFGNSGTGNFILGPDVQ